MFTPTESVTEDAGDEGTVSSKGRGHQYEQIQNKKQKKKKSESTHLSGAVRLEVSRRQQTSDWKPYR